MENTIQNNNFLAITTVKRRKLHVLLSRICSSRKPLRQTSGIPVQVFPTLVFACQDESSSAPSSYTSSCHTCKSRYRRWYSDSLRARWFVVPNPEEAGYLSRPERPLCSTILFYDGYRASVMGVEHPGRSVG
jgi:hypothetical protein